MMLDPVTTDSRHPADPVIAIIGPTAIGKSQVALLVAKALGTEILTADSTQVYRGMDIGTDKPTLGEREDVPHHLIDLVEPDQPFNAGEYRRHAQNEIARLHLRGRIPLVVGGTGLYIRALLRGLWASPPVDWKIRHQLEEEAKEKGKEALYHELAAVDPKTAHHLHPHDLVKVLRALEVFRQTGAPLSAQHDHHEFREHPYHSLIIGLTMNRATLYQRIEQRVEVELAKGLVEETRRLLDLGYHRQLVSMKSLGYRQMSAYLEGECDFQEAVRLLKRDTRHFAKRQMTWFKKEPDITWIEVKEDDSSATISTRVLQLIQQFLSNRPSDAFTNTPFAEVVINGTRNYA